MTRARRLSPLWADWWTPWYFRGALALGLRCVHVRRLRTGVVLCLHQVATRVRTRLCAGGRVGRSVLYAETWTAAGAARWSASAYMCPVTLLLWTQGHEHTALIDSVNETAGTAGPIDDLVLVPYESSLWWPCVAFHAPCKASHPLLHPAHSLRSLQCWCYQSLLDAAGQMREHTGAHTGHEFCTYPSHLSSDPCAGGTQVQKHPRAGGSSSVRATVPQLPGLASLRNWRASWCLDV